MSEIKISSDSKYKWMDWQGEKGERVTVRCGVLKKAGERQRREERKINPDLSQAVFLMKLRALLEGNEEPG